MTSDGFSLAALHTCSRIVPRTMLVMVMNISHQPPDLDLDAIGVALQPVVHDEIADRESDDSGDDN